MPCEHVTIPISTQDGVAYAHAIVCSRGRARDTRRCVVCGTTRNIKLCDFALKGPKEGQTCDRPVCGPHAHHRDPDYDLCPAHARLVQDPQLALEVPHA